MGAGRALDRSRCGRSGIRSRRPGCSKDQPGPPDRLPPFTRTSVRDAPAANHADPVRADGAQLAAEPAESSASSASGS
jgi:hypothetical protein